LRNGFIRTVDAKGTDAGGGGGASQGFFRAL